MKKRFFASIILIFTLILSAFPVFADDIKIYIDGQELITDVAPVSIEGTTMVPMRAIFEALGASINYNAETRQITALKDNSIIQFIVGANSATKNGVVYELTAAPQIINGSTMIPLRFAADALNCTVAWDGETQTVNITSNTLVPPVESQPVVEYIQPVQEVAPVVTAPVQGQSTAAVVKIYRTKTGKKYHHDPNCGNGTYYECTLEEAEAAGLTPCAKCVK